MKLKPVKSSNIASMAHDAKGKVLRVQFQSGKTYDYAGVDAKAFRALKKAESVGSHLNAHIKGKHEFSIYEEPKKEEKPKAD